jgi:hypothetical protein
VSSLPCSSVAVALALAIRPAMDPHTSSAGAEGSITAGRGSISDRDLPTIGHHLDSGSENRDA